MNSSHEVLTNGLLAGFAGNKIEDITRADFKGKASDVKFPNGDTYHDEWFVPSYSGGGQELVSAGGQMYTRLYGGGNPNPEVLQALGISVNDVVGQLIKTITALGAKTRLFENCTQDLGDQWQYEYKVTAQYPETETTTALETISFQNQVVHVHAFILCPVK